MSARGRNITLIAAGALLVIALILAVSIAGDDPLADVAEEINAFGYSLTPEDFYVLGGAGDTSIAALLEKDEAELAPVIEASRACGFPSDTLATGDITALLANTDRGVVTVYMRDGNIELCFLQTEEGEILPLK